MSLIALIPVDDREPFFKLALTFAEVTEFVGGPVEVVRLPAVGSAPAGALLVHEEAALMDLPVNSVSSEHATRALRTHTVIRGPTVWVPESRMDEVLGGVEEGDGDDAAARLEVAERDLAQVRGLVDGLRGQLAASERARTILAGALAECFECMETAAQAIPLDTPFRRVSAEALREVAQDGRTALHHAQGAVDGEA